MAPSPLFICYSTRDGAQFARRLVQALESDSPAFDTYRDTDLRAGQHWDAQLRRAIEECSGLLFVVTKDSVRDDSVCKQEWMYARDKGKRIIPLLIDAAVPAPFGLRSVQHIDFSGDFEASMAKLRADLAGAAPVPGREWRGHRRWPLPVIAGSAALLGVLILGIAAMRLGAWPGRGEAATTPAPGQASLTCPASDPCRYQVELGGNPCLERTNGGMVDVRSCDGSGDQQWIEDHRGSQFTLRNQATNRCIAAGAVGKQLEMSSCSDRRTMWTSTANGDRSYTFHSVAQPGACIAGAGTEGGPVVLRPCSDGAADQRWY